MTTPTQTLRPLAAVAGGATFVFTGAIQATQEFGGTHNTIDSTAEYLVTGALPVALALTIPMYHLFGRLAGAPRAALAAMAAQAVLALMCVVSVINGADASFFNAVAPVCLLTWLAGSVALTRGLRRTGAVPAPVAYALPGLLIATFMASPIGGAMLTGAYWIAVGTLLHRGAIARPAVAVAAAA